MTRSARRYDGTVSHHINFGVIEDDCCRASFIRGAFLAGGSVTDPEKRYHLELATPHHSVSREAYSVLLELGLHARRRRSAAGTGCCTSSRRSHRRLLHAIGAPVTAMDIMTAKVEKEMRNTITRRVNCDSANADKVVAAAQEQIDAIRRIVREYGHRRAAGAAEGRRAAAHTRIPRRASPTLRRCPIRR